MRLKNAFLPFCLFVLSEALPFVAGTNGAELLVNAGFEEPAPTLGWEVNTYGAHPKFDSEAAEFRRGRASLRIQATEPSDTALAQEVIVQPGQWYRYSAWVRTAGLDPKESAVSATLQAQRPKGAGVIAGGV